MGVQLDIINSMLAAISTSGLTTLTGVHPSLIKTLPVLERHNTVIQSKGHWFNTDWKLKLLPNGSGEFVLPQGVLKADTSDASLAFVRRNTKMYDPKNHTYEITTVQSMEVDVVIKLDYDDLPVAAYEYIRCAATMELVANSSADSINMQYHKQMLGEALAEFNIQKRSQADLSLRDNPSYARIVYGLNGQNVSHRAAYIGGLKG